MPLSERVETAIATALSATRGEQAPKRLSEALEYATLPGGARIRPTILLSVAKACGDDRPELSNAGAAALELMHCASLVLTICPVLTMRNCGAANRLCTARIPSHWPC